MENRKQAGDIKPQASLRQGSRAQQSEPSLKSQVSSLKSQVSSLKRCCRENKGKTLVASLMLVGAAIASGLGEGQPLRNIIESAAFCFVVNQFIEVSCDELNREEAKQDAKQTGR